MKAEVLIEMMLSEQYNSLTVSEFGAICRDTLRVEEEKFSDDVMTAQDIQNEYKIVQHDNGETEFVFDDEENERIQERKEEEEHYADYSDQEYDKASSNVGELI